MRVQFLAIALCASAISSSAVAQRWGETRPPESWTFLGYADSEYYSDVAQSEGKARFFVQSTDDASMPLPAGLHNWAAILVFDEEQRTRDGHLYWQRGIAGGVNCPENQITVNFVHALDKEGNILIDDWIKDAKPAPVKSAADIKIYNFICKK
jgi:hypothetical protein